MSELYRITIDPSQCGGRPCLRGLRIRVMDILELLASGATREEVLADYPILEAGDITAALEYAARQCDHRNPAAPAHDPQTAAAVIASAAKQSSGPSRVATSGSLHCARDDGRGYAVTRRQSLS